MQDRILAEVNEVCGDQRLATLTASRMRSVVHSGFSSQNDSGFFTPLTIPLRSPALDDVPLLVYTDAVIKETLRLFPPAVIVRNYRIQCRVGVCVCVCVCVCVRDVLCVCVVFKHVLFTRNRAAPHLCVIRFPR